MNKPLDDEIQLRLDSYRRDFEKTTGRPFKHFFCPILGVDEPIAGRDRLIKGHVINRSFENTPRAWVVQRSDVDNFYGSHFESEFELTQYRDRMTMVDVLSDQKLAKKFRPKILMNGAEIGFSSRRSGHAGQFTPVELGEGNDGPMIEVKMSPQKMVANAKEKWEFLLVKDLGVSVLASVIKSAHLTLFHLLGYRYATSAAGRFVGCDILGRFFLENVGRSKKEVRTRAWSHFREFASMFRPLLHVDVGYRGTVADHLLLVCHTTSGEIWAQIVLVKAGDQMHAVMIPVFTSADSVPIFLDFLKNDNERIQVSTAQFDATNQSWLMYSDRKEQFWPKQGLLYPERPDELLGNEWFQPIRFC